MIFVSFVVAITSTQDEIVQRRHLDRHFTELGVDYSDGLAMYGFRGHLNSVVPGTYGL
jgi:hypothetical protein